MGPLKKFQEMYQDLTQMGFSRPELQNPHVLDLFDEMFPVDVVDPLSAREAAQQIGLLFRPSESIAVMEIIPACPLNHW
jgi:hypothetical protein